MELDLGSVFTGILGVVFSAYGSFLVFSARKKLTPGLVKKLVDVVWYSFLNLIVYSTWILLLSTGLVKISNVIVKEVPTITLLFLFLVLALKTKKLADEYGFAAG